MIPGPAPRRWALIAPAAMALLGLANLAYRVRGDLPGADFRALWIAGTVWRQGSGPYGAAYHLIGLHAFGPAYPQIWPYPPHIWLLAILFGLSPPAIGLAVWNGMGIALTAAAGALLGWTFARETVTRIGIALALVAYVGCMSASGAAFLIGQIGYLMLFALALAAWGIARRNLAAPALALVILMLVPQVGLIAAIALLALRRGWIAVALAAAIIAVESLPAMLAEGVTPVIDGYLYESARYQALPFNRPIAITGIGHLIAEAGGGGLPAIAMSLAGGAVAAALLWVRRGRRRRVDGAADWLLVTIGAIAGFASLHGYDLMLVAPLIALLPRVGVGLRGLLIVLGLALILRPENLALLFHREAGVAIASVGCVVLLAAAVRQTLSKAMRPPRSRAAPPRP